MRTFVCAFTFLMTSNLLAAEWPQFRGPNGQGHVTGKRLAMKWSEDESITWKTNIPGLGWSSPVVVENEIWMTTATNDGRSLRAVCVNRSNGKLLHNIEVFTKSKAANAHSQNSHASPTPVIERDHVFVHFGPSGTACLTRTGEVVWKADRFWYDTPHGNASSPVVHGDLVLICCDGSNKQFVAALDKKTGDTVWQHDRAHMEDAHRKSNAEQNEDRKGLPFISFSTPLVADVDGTAIMISTPADHVVANRVDNGKEVWWHPYNCFSLVARPVVGNGMVYAIGGIRDGHYKLFAIPLTSEGKVSEDQLVWTRDVGVPQVPSPILIGGELFLVNDKGVATCLDAKTGEEIWRHRLGGNYRASPIAIGEHIYATTQKGKTKIFKADREFKMVAENKLDGVFLASPAAAGGSLFLRSDQHLYRID